MSCEDSHLPLRKVKTWNFRTPYWVKIRKIWVVYSYLSVGLNHGLAMARVDFVATVGTKTDPEIIITGL
jgi:hypothetical protein